MIFSSRPAALSLILAAGWLCAGSLTSSGAVFPLTWRWSNPTPHGNNIIDVAYTNGFWIQVAERGQIYTSGDKVNWTPRDSHTTRALRAVTFLRDQIVIVGESGAVVTGPSATELSVIDLDTPDWLEGVAASAQTAVAVGDEGAIYTSADGRAWQRQNVPFSDWLRSVAYGTPGGVGMFCAVGEAGFVATSTNGTRWQVENKFTSQDLNRVGWFSGEFWTVGNGGTTFQSSSGKTWVNAGTGATNILNAFAGRDSMRLVAGEGEVRIRNGRTWANQLSAALQFPAPDWTYLSAAADTNSFLLCGRTGIMVEGISASPAEQAWLTLSDSPRNWLWDVKRFPSVYLAVGDRATIMSSVDGIAWDLELPPDAATNAIFLGIGGTTNIAVAVGNGGAIITSFDTPEMVVSTNANGTVVTNKVSTLGIYWQAMSARPATEDLQGVTAFQNQFVVSGAAGTILTSSDALSWTRQSTPVSEFLSTVEAFPEGVVAAGRNGTLLSSADGVNWTTRASGTTDWIYRVRFAGGKLVAVGQNGTVLTSIDGRTWTRQISGSTRWLNDVIWVGDTYFAVGNQGTVLSSPDAVTWTDRGTITGKSLFGAATSGGMLITVGVEGAILRSQVTPFDTPVAFLRHPRGPEESIFLFAGQAGQRFSLDRSTDLTRWAAGPQLEIDPTGTLLYLDSTTNAAPVQFFRARPAP